MKKNIALFDRQGNEWYVLEVPKIPVEMEEIGRGESESRIVFSSNPDPCFTGKFKVEERLRISAEYKGDRIPTFTFQRGS